MNPKVLNWSALAFLLGLMLVAGFSVYQRGQASVRAETAEQALEDSTQTYRQRERHLRALMRADSAAEAVRLALRAPVEPAVTRYVTLRDTITYTDTLLVEAADEAVTTCSFALLSCESRIGTQQAVVDSLQAQVLNLEAQLAATRSVADAACSGRVPTWTLPVGIGLGLVGGAWVRGQD